MLSITAIPGLRVGHAHDPVALTGCTVLLCESGAVGGVDQRGGAPGTRETAALHPMNLVQEVHAVVLTGGSAFGLDSASGVVRYLEERGSGLDTQLARVPVVAAAVLFDLGLGSATVRPDAGMGYQACLNATHEAPAEGNVGAGMGASVGKILGMNQAVKTGIGCAAIEVSPGLYVGALAAVNAFGDILDPDSGRIIAGARTLPGSPPGPAHPFADTMAVMSALSSQHNVNFGERAEPPAPGGQNTVIGIVATNARLDKVEANKVAQMAHDGLARTVCPAHTMLDGDTIFALSAGEIPADVNTIGAFAAKVFSQAVLRAVHFAEPAGGLPSASSLQARDSAS